MNEVFQVSQYDVIDPGWNERVIADLKVVLFASSI